MGAGVSLPKGSAFPGFSDVLSSECSLPPDGSDLQTLEAATVSVVQLRALLREGARQLKLDRELREHIGGAKINGNSFRAQHLKAVRTRQGGGGETTPPRGN